MTADTGADDDVADDARGSAAPRSGDGDVSGEGGDSNDRRSTADASAGASTDVTARSDAVDSDEGAELREEVDDLRADLDALETRIDEKTVHRDDVRSELRRYVRKRQRRGHATGWGPYLVLLYGTAMTVAAFFYLGDLAAIFAMFVIWLSTLGLYVVMVVVGVFVGVGRKLGGLRDLVGKIRG